ncbi:MAG: hypothetical protein PHG03_05640 [Bacilli bacterium]|nr:hypothetical protein [Bacilli bacterium]MDD4796014.1 hypothetical protein [Bacilli bacterium]
MDTKLKLLLILSIVMIFVLVIFTYYLLIFKRSNKLKKRLTSYKKEKK